MRPPQGALHAAAAVTIVLAAVAALVLVSAGPDLAEPGAVDVPVRFRPCLRGAPAPPPGPVRRFFNSSLYMDVAPRARSAALWLKQTRFLHGCHPDRCAVADMGAGHMELKRALAKEGLEALAEYLPVDIESRHNGTVVCDLNALQFPFAELAGKERVAFAFLGSFDYVLSKVDVLRATALFGRSVVLLQYRARERLVRPEYMWVTPFSESDFGYVCLLLGCSFELTSKPGAEVMTRHHPAP
ncbi:hypothetical protein DFJ74DRAFT_646665 [Hyaloraphidium curvatum]|nr:hypothetical protein DFJ74DRAFT_646665 [Hyaloraphidium curvatum]